MKISSCTEIVMFFHGFLFEAACCIFGASLATRRCPFDILHSPSCCFLSPLTVRAPSPISLSPCQCASGCLEALTHISAVYLSPSFHFACIPCSLIRPGYKERGRAQRVREDGGKRLDNQKYFPTNWV